MINDLYHRLDKIESDIDAMKNLVDDVLMSANNAIDSVQTTVTFGAIIVAIISIGLQRHWAKETKKETKYLIQEHMKNNPEFKGHIKTYFKSNDFKKLVKEYVDSETTNDTGDETHLDKDNIK